MLAAVLLVSTFPTSAPGHAADRASTTDDINAYHAAIADAELRAGAYSDQLAEPLLGLATLMQA
ncbi:MAG: hypothetical protein KDI09_14795, partial [Halioglobus sp.]|nr:hypothetical protein [Halioglobus sp.]